MPRRKQDDWDIEYDRGFPDEIASDKKGGFTFNLYGDRVISCALREPEGPLWKKMPPPSRSITLVVRVSEIPGTVWDTNPMGQEVPPDVPPQMGLIIHRDWNGVFNRFYSNDRLELVPGLHTLTVPLNPAAWMSVMAKNGAQNGPTRDRWRECFLSRTTRIGVVMGGHFRGHGLRVPEGMATVSVVALRH